MHFGVFLILPVWTPRGNADSGVTCSDRINWSAMWSELWAYFGAVWIRWSELTDEVKSGISVSGWLCMSAQLVLQGFLCYGNINYTYNTHVQASYIGELDHNVIHLLPKHRRLVKRVKPAVKTSLEWGKWWKVKRLFRINRLRRFIWHVYWSAQADWLRYITYTQFCEQSVVCARKLAVFPNNKPRLTKELEGCFNGCVSWWWHSRLLW